MPLVAIILVLIFIVYIFIKKVKLLCKIVIRKIR